MDHHRDSGRAPGGRQPLGDATNLSINAHLGGPNHRSHHKSDSLSIAKEKAAARGVSNPVQRNLFPVEHHHGRSVSATVDTSRVLVDKRISAITQASQQSADSHRTHGYLTISPDGTIRRREKQNIGPWALGRMLGQGSSAHVRLGNHRLTGQKVAIKIIRKSMAHVTQAGSLANLERIDRTKAAANYGSYAQRMPVAIEREVAILKLVEHPNILQLFDIWENRHEIYMVTEWVEKGDMFDFINWNGALREEEALFYFRQMMSAIGYCHSLGICHRDLKPENILLKADGTVKIADFGMAALQQNPSHQLRTACGSPHYAAPELLRHQFYKGSAVDIWSLGVILYAMLAGCLPFDDEDVNLMLSKALKADFTFPRIISHEARDLISKILVPQPAKRITMKQMWKHPLIRKYSYLDDLHLRTGDVPRNADAEPVPEHEICPQILRQLCSLWHGYTEDHLKTKLTQDKPNDQKLFYWLLLEHREGQLENYNRNQVPISKSDHHHLKPPGWTRRVATCHFADENEVGPSRGGSKFTVVSSVSNPVDADDSATVQSYDPFNASRDPQLPAPKMALPKVTVHRNDGESDAASMKTNTTRSYHAFRAVGGSFQKVNSQALISKHKAAGSTASSLRSAHSNTPRVVPNSRSKRGVNFSAIRNAKRRGHQHNKEASGYLQAAVIHQETTSSRNAERQVAAQKTNSRSGPKPRENVSAKAEALRLRRSSGTPREDSEIWNEELQKHSRLIAEDCDKAFQSSLIFAESALEQPSREASPFSLSLDLGAGTVRSMSAGPIGNLPVPNQLPAPKPWDNRPLPPTPAPSVTPVPTTRNFSMHITPIPKSVDDRRIVSEPVRSEGEKHAASLAQKARHVPSVTNASSYCPKTPTAIENQGLDALGPAEQTIRFVHSPSAVPVPAPLKVRKVSAQDRDSIAPLPLTTVGQARDRAAADRGRDESDREKVEEAHDRVVSWFKRGEKQDEVIAALDRETIRRASKQKAATKEDVEVKSKSKGKELAKASSKEREVEKRASKEKPKEKSKDKSKDERKSCDKKELSVDEGSSIKKKGGFRFSFALWKKEKEKAKDEKPVEDNHSVSISSDGRATAKQHPKASKQKLSAQISVWKDEDNTSDEGSITGRQIEVHQNWLFRLLRVKPAQRHMCLILPRQRARQEIAIQLRQWRQYGIRDVEVDKERNLIFARVAAKNYLSIKEVAFAIEVSAMIEHGKPGRPHKNSSIARFTQERGAASSFYKVFEALHREFLERNLLITDQSKVARMVQTLNTVLEQPA